MSEAGIANAPSADIVKEADAAVYAQVLKRYSVFYQPTGDGKVTAFRARLAPHAAVRKTEGVKT